MGYGRPFKAEPEDLPATLFLHLMTYVIGLSDHLRRPIYALITMARKLVSALGFWVEHGPGNSKPGGINVSIYQKEYLGHTGSRLCSFDSRGSLFFLSATQKPVQIREASASLFLLQR
jgi:hypothetical protein